MRCVRSMQLVGALLFAAILPAAPNAAAAAERAVVSLDGPWSVAESVAAEPVPAAFDRTCPVPGLAQQAQPPLPDINHYETHEYVFTMKKYGILPTDTACPEVGHTRQKRNYVWYSRTFDAPPQKEFARLIVHKAQFGTAVWLNGQKLGERLDCFTAGYFDATAAIKWGGPNRVVIRIGAHPGVLPLSALYGTDGEKGPWTPGIYDRVELIAANYPLIESVQVAPQVDQRAIVIETRLRNGPQPHKFTLAQQVRTWKDNREAGPGVGQNLDLAAGEERTVRQTLSVPDAQLWSPENPFLYVLHTATDRDATTTRFGMRQLRFDPQTKQAVLNGQPIFLRGSSITLHRFFGDPVCGGLPWDEAWLRRFLVDLPRQMHWNCFRLCIGPPPQHWLELADEAGLILQYEYPIWSDREPLRHKFWNVDEVTASFRDFMRDSWNHPSVALWDASNETHWDVLAKQVIPAVRGLDLSDRPWENGYNAPHRDTDPWEDHPYLFIDHVFGKKPPFFSMEKLETLPGLKAPMTGWKATHASIINEYDWLWLHRDGTPTALTQKVFDHVLGPQATAEERRQWAAYCLGGITEFWRVHRRYAGVLYLAYLDADLPTAFTCDNFRDVPRLEFEPHFADYVGEAFKPAGVYINFWQPKLAAGSPREYQVMLVNDLGRKLNGRLTLSWQDTAGKTLGEVATDTTLEAYGQGQHRLNLATPARPGRYLLVARLAIAGSPDKPTLSRRKVEVE